MQPWHFHGPRISAIGWTIDFGFPKIVAISRTIALALCSKSPPSAIQPRFCGSARISPIVWASALSLPQLIVVALWISRNFPNRLIVAPALSLPQYFCNPSDYSVGAVATQNFHHYLIYSLGTLVTRKYYRLGTSAVRYVPP